MSEATEACRDRNRAEVVAAIPPGALTTARQIWERLGKWAPQTVKAMLVEAVARGEATRVMRNGVWWYSRKSVGSHDPAGTAVPGRGNDTVEGADRRIAVVAPANYSGFRCP